MVPLLEISSLSVARCGSGATLVITTLGLSTSIMQRCIIGISPPGNGYFHSLSVGLPTLVVTKYISLTLRWSSLKVTIFFESADQTSTALSLCFQPALSVA